MATIPTNNQVPSESPRDLKFNAGKIDEFVTSLLDQYIDRFGVGHYTIEGLKKLVLNHIYNLGWKPVGTFQSGAVADSAGSVVQDTSNGIWYRWDDLSTLPKVVVSGSTPDSSGGIGEGKWLAVDINENLRKDLNKNTGAELVRAGDGRTVQQWLVAVDSAEYRAKNIAKLAWVDYQVHNYGAINILFQGDSLTAGYDRASTDIVPPDNGDWATHASMTYTKRFVDFLAEQSGCKPVRTIRAISGYTARQGYENPDWQTNPNCDIAVLMFGINDADASTPDTLDQYMDYMEKLIRRFIGWGMGVVVCLPAGGQSENALWLQWSKRANMMAHIYGCVIFDGHGPSLSRHKGAISSDGLHYNSMGYAILGRQLASMFMAGGLLPDYNPVRNETYMFCGTVSQHYGWSDANKNMTIARDDLSFTRNKGVGILPAGKACIASFSFYLDSEAAHITGKISGPCTVIHEDPSWWNNSAKSYYAQGNAQIPFFSTGLNRTAVPATSNYGNPTTYGGTQFIGRLVGRGWHTISIFNAQDGSATSPSNVNALNITPVPVGMSNDGMWTGSDERRLRVVSVKKIPSPAGQGANTPAAQPLTEFSLRAPQSLLPTGIGSYQADPSVYYNSGPAKLRIITHGGYYLEAIVVRTKPGWEFDVKIVNHNFPAGNTPTMIGYLATASRNAIVLPGAEGTNQPVESIYDYNNGIILTKNDPSAGFVGGIYIYFTVTWPVPITDFWNLELEGTDFFGNSEPAFGAY